MSYSFRERLKACIAKDLREKLSLTQDEIDWIKENLTGELCRISDEFAEALAKHDPRFSGKNLDEIIELMTDDEFEDFVREVIEEAKKRLKYKKKEKKKQKESDEEESEEESEKDSDSDSDTTSEQEQEAEVACQ